MTSKKNGKLILLNGPIGCGKTELSEHLKYSLHELGIEIKDRRCKDHLHKLTMMFFNVPEDTYWEIYNTRTLKETPNSLFRVSIGAYNQLAKIIKNLPKKNENWVDLTIRQAMIFVSEVLCKPTFGKDYFGRVRVESMLEGEVAIDDSTGFEEELYPAIESLGQENILMIKILNRGDFGGDSRSFIEDGVIENTAYIDNGEISFDEFLKKGNVLVSSFLEVNK